MEALQKQGIKFITPSPDAIDEWRQTAAQIPQASVKDGRISAETMSMLETLLQQYRSGHGAKP
jgi:hypothetical protein